MKRDTTAPFPRRRKIITVSRGEAAMTWAEIAAALGYDDTKHRGTKAVVMCYRNAMRKIRQRPGAIRALAELVAFREHERPLPIISDAEEE